MLTLRTNLLTGVITVHNGLQDTCEWSHTYASCDEYRVTGVKDVTRWGTIRTVYSDLI